MDMTSAAGDWWTALQPQPAQDSSSILSSMGTGVKDALGSVLSLFDNGLNVYMGVAERVAAMKLLNSQIATNAQQLINPTPTDQISNFFKSQTGIIVVGALGVLIVGALVLRK